MKSALTFLIVSISQEKFKAEIGGQKLFVCFIPSRPSFEDIATSSFSFSHAVMLYKQNLQGNVTWNSSVGIQEAVSKDD